MPLAARNHHPWPSIRRFVGPKADAIPTAESRLRRFLVVWRAQTQSHFSLGEGGETSLSLRSRLLGPNLAGVTEEGGPPWPGRCRIKAAVRLLAVGAQEAEARQLAVQPTNTLAAAADQWPIVSRSGPPPPQLPSSRSRHHQGQKPGARAEQAPQLEHGWIKDSGTQVCQLGARAQVYKLDSNTTGIIR